MARLADYVVFADKQLNKYIFPGADASLPLSEMSKATEAVAQNGAPKRAHLVAGALRHW